MIEIPLVLCHYFVHHAKQAFCFPEFLLQESYTLSQFLMARQGILDSWLPVSSASDNGWAFACPLLFYLSCCSYAFSVAFFLSFLFLWQNNLTLRKQLILWQTKYLNCLQ
jgi:hypothetical protein